LFILYRKTITAIHTIQYYLNKKNVDKPYRALVLSPKTLVGNFEKEMMFYGLSKQELKKISVESIHQFALLFQKPNDDMIDGAKDAKNKRPKKVPIVRESIKLKTKLKYIKQQLRKHYDWDKYNWILCLDEIHTVRNPTSLHGILMRYVSYFCQKRIGLTATLPYNTFGDCSNPLAIIRGELHCIPPKQINKWCANLEKYGGYVKSLYNDYVSSANIKEDTSSYPAIQKITIELPMTENEYEQYMKLEIKAITDAPTKKKSDSDNDDDDYDDNSDPELTTGSNAFYTLLRQMINKLGDKEIKEDIESSSAEEAYFKSITSSKAKWILENIKKNPGQNVVTSNFKKSGIEIIVDGLKAMNDNDDNNNNNNNNKKKNKNKSDSDDDDKPDNNKYKFQKITGETVGSQRQKIVDSYNHWKTNTLLLSKASDTGIDLWHTKALYKFEPSWNIASEDQKDGRVARFESHSDLPLEERIVKIYTILMVKPKHVFEDNPDEKLSVDLYLYNLALKKQKIIDNTLGYLGGYEGKEYDPNFALFLNKKDFKAAQEEDNDNDSDDDDDDEKEEKKKKKKKQSDAADPNIKYTYRQLYRISKRKIGKMILPNSHIFNSHKPPTGRQVKYISDVTLRTKRYIYENLRLKFYKSIEYMNTNNDDEVFNDNENLDDDDDDDENDLDLSGRRIFTKNPVSKHYIEWKVFGKKKANKQSGVQKEIIYNPVSRIFADLEYKKDKHLWNVISNNNKQQIVDFTPYIRQTYSLLDEQQKVRVYYLCLNGNDSDDDSDVIMDDDDDEPHNNNNIKTNKDKKDDNKMKVLAEIDKAVVLSSEATGIKIQFKDTNFKIVQKTFTFNNEYDPYFGAWIYKENDDYIYCLSFFEMFGYSYTT